MEILQPHRKLDRLDAAVFDFDGTLSKLRAGWEGVMEPLMCELIPGDPDEVRALVKKYIDDSTGIQTIFQIPPPGTKVSTGSLHTRTVPNTKTHGTSTRNTRCVPST